MVINTKAVPTTLIISDIFGLTPSLSALASKLSASQNTLVLDPYQGKTKTFTTESDAYQAFIDNCGHDKFFELTCQIIQQHNIDNIIAFSAGASAAYRAICEYPVRHLIGFYPSQIRHHLNLKPTSPVTLIFPATEPHFDIAKVMKTVAKCQSVTCLQSAQNHGFMNPQSAGFNQHHASKFEQVLSQHKLSNHQFIQYQCQEICQHDRQQSE